MDIPFKRELLCFFQPPRIYDMGQLFWVEKSTFLSLFRRVLELLIALDLQIFCYLSLRKTHVCFDVRLLKLIRKGIIQKNMVGNS